MSLESSSKTTLNSGPHDAKYGHHLCNPAWNEHFVTTSSRGQWHDAHGSGPSEAVGLLSDSFSSASYLFATPPIYHSTGDSFSKSQACIESSSASHMP